MDLDLSRTRRYRRGCLGLRRRIIDQEFYRTSRQKRILDIAKFKSALYSMIRLFQLPWGLAAALLAASCFEPRLVSAGPSVNIAMKAAFPSSPYLIELLYEPLFCILILHSANSNLEKLLPKRMDPATFLSSIASPTATSQTLQQTRIYMRSS